MIYIASKYQNQEVCRRIRDELSILCNSSWLDQEGEMDPREAAERDMQQILEANYFLLYNIKPQENLENTHAPSFSAAHQVEVGIALASAKLCFRIGPITNIFHRMMHEVENVHDLEKRIRVHQMDIVRLTKIKEHSSSFHCRRTTTDSRVA